MRGIDSHVILLFRVNNLEAKFLVELQSIVVTNLYVPVCKKVKNVLLMTSVMYFQVHLQVNIVNVAVCFCTFENMFQQCCTCVYMWKCVCVCAYSVALPTGEYEQTTTLPEQKIDESK